MPQTIAIAAFVLGAVLVLASLVTGGVKIFGAEVSGINSGAARAVAFLLGSSLLVAGFFVEKSTGVSASGREVSGQSAPTITSTTAPRPANAGQPGNLAFGWQHDPVTVQTVVSQMTPFERESLRANRIVTGVDIYAVRVEIANIGKQAIDVDPSHVQARTAVGVILPTESPDRPGFLRPTSLPPGQQVVGSLIIQAPVSAMESGNVSIEYVHPSATVLRK